MPLEKRRAWRLKYFEQKRFVECGRDGFITDRSFVDIAAYWMVCNNPDNEACWDVLLTPCRKLSAEYDIHFTFPRASFPVVLGGRRSRDERLYVAIDTQIQLLLGSWGLKSIALANPSLTVRSEQVRAWAKTALTRPQ